MPGHAGLVCLSVLLTVGAAWGEWQGPYDPFQGHSQEEGWPVRVCWPGYEPGVTLRALDVKETTVGFNATAAAIRHMMELGMDDLQACEYCVACNGTWHH